MRGEGVGPLAGPAQIERGHARVDRCAVDDAGGDGRQLTAGDAEHRLVEQLHAMPHVTQGDAHLALAHQPPRQQVAVAEAVGQLDHLDGTRPSGVQVAGHQRLVVGGDEREAPGGAARVGAVGEAFGPREPAGGVGGLATQEERHAQPDGRPGRVGVPAGDLIGAVGALPGPRAQLLVAHQVGDHGEPLEVLGIEDRRSVELTQDDVRLVPCPPLEGLAASPHSTHG
ncbi:MAG: hypothetical protein ACRD03_14500 [Acidimicrobiales bacterium]